MPKAKPPAHRKSVIRNPARPKTAQVKSARPKPVRQKPTPASDAMDTVASSRITWYPGHMKKTQDRLALEIKNAHLVVEIRDARLPFLSANAELDRLVGNQQRLVVFNKASMANPGANQKLLALYGQHDIPVLALDLLDPQGANRVIPLIGQLTERFQQTFLRRHIRPPLPRVVVLGIPNVGKSTLINRLLGRRNQTVSAVPGTTRAMTWTPVKNQFLLMDSPGVMLPRIATDMDGYRLCWIGAIPDHLVGSERLATALLDHLLATSPESLTKAYELSASLPTQGETCLPWLALQRGVLKKGGLPDAIRMGEILLTDFRKGVLGRHTLETLPASL